MTVLLTASKHGATLESGETIPRSRGAGCARQFVEIDAVGLGRCEGDWRDWAAVDEWAGAIAHELQATADKHGVTMMKGGI